jgi:transposase-like protein
MPPFLAPVERLILIRDGFYSPDARCHTRAAAILALDQGHSLRSVARSVRCHRDTLYRWLDKYLEKRDVAALSDGWTRAARRRTRRLWPQRAAALVALAGEFGRPEAEPGRLNLDPAARAILARAASEAEANPARRYQAALLWAFDRGLPVSAIARTAGGISRRILYEAPARYLPRILGAGAGQGA